MQAILLGNEERMSVLVFRKQTHFTQTLLTDTCPTIVKRCIEQYRCDTIFAPHCLFNWILHNASSAKVILKKRKRTSCSTTDLLAFVDDIKRDDPESSRCAEQWHSWIDWSHNVVDR